MPQPRTTEGTVGPSRVWSTWCEFGLQHEKIIPNIPKVVSVSEKHAESKKASKAFGNAVTLQKKT